MQLIRITFYCIENMKAFHLVKDCVDCMIIIFNTCITSNYRQLWSPSKSVIFVMSMNKIAL